VGMWSKLDSMITGYLDSVTIEDLRCSPRGIDYVI
jgi:Rrf2 family iron-sulfur cluster assembly transcriptional regulator